MTYTLFFVFSRYWLVSTTIDGYNVSGSYRSLWLHFGRKWFYFGVFHLLMSFICPELSGFQAPEIRLSHHHYLWKHPHHEKARVGAWLPEALFRLPFGAFRRQRELILFATPALAVLWRGNNYFEQLKYKLCSRSPTILTVPVYNAMRTNLLVFEACTIVVIWLLYCYVSPKIDLLVHEIDQYTQESALARTKTYKSTSRWNKSDISGDFYGLKLFFSYPGGHLGKNGRHVENPRG